MVQVVEQRTVVILVSCVPMTTEGLSVCVFASITSWEDANQRAETCLYFACRSCSLCVSTVCSVAPFLIFCMWIFNIKRISLQKNCHCAQHQNRYETGYITSTEGILLCIHKHNHKLLFLIVKSIPLYRYTVDKS